jgi:oligopeptide transport system substrate-binding protein
VRGRGGGATGAEEPVAEGPVEGGTFNFYISEPAFIDPVNLQESEGTQVGQALFDSLVTFDPISMEVQPAAAETWESNDEATVWTFNLVEGAMFHNGREVTAQDFKYAWERIAIPRTSPRSRITSRQSRVTMRCRTARRPSFPVSSPSMTTRSRSH